MMTENRAFFNQLKKYYTWYTGGFVVFVLFLAVAEQMGMSKQMMGYIFLGATIALYAGIGVRSPRTGSV
jgi:cation/acetate symporter